MNDQLTSPSGWLDSAIKVTLIGAGGNGSEALDILAQFHTTMISLGHPYGLEVTVYDGSVVREPNLVRQKFWPSDLGQFKSVALVNRYNMFLGTTWKAVPRDFTRDDPVGNSGIIITAVDLPSVRTFISLSKPDFPVYWLDLGNETSHGQAVLGLLSKSKKLAKRYPNVALVYPELPSLADDPSKSCSVAESIAKQDVLVNRTVTTAGMNMLWQLLRKGSVDFNGVVVDLNSGTQLPIPFPQNTA